MKHLDKLANEIQSAREKYGPFNSTHELYGVLKEELDEFWDEAKKKTVTFDDAQKEYSFAETKKKQMIYELMQIAAIALRGMSELENHEIKWV